MFRTVQPLDSLWIRLENGECCGTSALRNLTIAGIEMTRPSVLESPPPRINRVGADIVAAVAADELDPETVCSSLPFPFCPTESSLIAAAASSSASLSFSLPPSLYPPPTALYLLARYSQSAANTCPEPSGERSIPIGRPDLVQIPFTQFLRPKHCGATVQHGFCLDTI